MVSRKNMLASETNGKHISNDITSIWDMGNDEKKKKEEENEVRKSQAQKKEEISIRELT